MPKTKTPSEALSTLWEVASKLQGLGEIFNQSDGEQPFSETGLSGIGFILSDLSRQVEDARDMIEFGPKTDDEVVTSPECAFPE